MAEEVARIRKDGDESTWGRRPTGRRYGLEQVHHRPPDGARVDQITPLGWVQEIGHYQRGDRAIGLEEVAADIEIPDAVAVVQRGNPAIHLHDRIAERLSGRLAPWEDAQQQDSGLRGL